MENVRLRYQMLVKKKWHGLWGRNQICFISSAAWSIVLNINVNSIPNRSVKQHAGSVNGRMHSGISIGAGKISPRASFPLIYVLNILYEKYYFQDLDLISHITAEIIIQLDQGDCMIAFAADWLAGGCTLLLIRHMPGLSLETVEMLSAATVKPVLSPRILHMKDTNGGYRNIARENLDIHPAVKRKSILSLLSVWPFFF